MRIYAKYITFQRAVNRVPGTYITKGAHNASLIEFQDMKFHRLTQRNFCAIFNVIDVRHINKISLARQAEMRKYFRNKFELMQNCNISCIQGNILHYSKKIFLKKKQLLQYFMPTISCTMLCEKIEYYTL